MKLASLVIVLCVAVADAPTAHACLWDNDTLKEEALRDKDLTQVLRGELRKHSVAFYEAKVTYTRAIIDAGGKRANKERHDDLAVALAKLGKLDDAIAVLAAKDKLFPGEYTTEANHGTFLAMKGDLAGALDHLRKAVAINADAHFGREKVQIQLLEYMQRLAADPALAKTENFLGVAMSLDTVIAGQRKTRKRDRAIDQSIKAIVGLIRFGDAHANPHVWFGLGWALLASGDVVLATRAFRAAELAGHSRAATDGGMWAYAVRDFKLDHPCCPEEGSADVTRAWATITTAIDAEVIAGGKRDTARQAREDKQVAKQRWRAAFGY